MRCSITLNEVKPTAYSPGTRPLGPQLTQRRENHLPTWWRCVDFTQIFHVLVWPDAPRYAHALYRFGNEQVLRGQPCRENQARPPAEATERHLSTVGTLGCRNDKVTRTITVDTHSGPLVRTALELYATGTHTLKRLRDKVNALGPIGKKGRDFSASNYQYILRNPAYFGTIRCGANGPEFEGWPFGFPVSAGVCGLSFVPATGLCGDGGFPVFWRFAAARRWRRCWLC